VSASHSTTASAQQNRHTISFIPSCVMRAEGRVDDRAESGSVAVRESGLRKQPIG
jgi:hypothetical protein